MDLHVWDWVIHFSFLETGLCTLLVMLPVYFKWIYFNWF